MATPRRVKLWMKHSISSLSQEPTKFPVLESTGDCRNVDEALQAFRVDDEHCGLPVVVVVTGGDDNNNNSVDYDWILDGKKDNDYHARRSRELMDMLKAPEIEDVVSLRDPILGRQGLQFAEFPDATENVDDDTDDSDFGDFQDASSTKGEGTDDQVVAGQSGRTKTERSPSTDESAREEAQESSSEVGDQSSNGDFGDFQDASPTKPTGNDVNSKRQAPSRKLEQDASSNPGGEEKKDSVGTIEASSVERNCGDFKEEAAPTADVNNRNDVANKKKSSNPGEEEGDSVRVVDARPQQQAIYVPQEVKVRGDSRRALLSVVSDNWSESEFENESNESSSEDELDTEDVTTLEGRFLRRNKKTKKPMSVSLPQHFQEEGGDASLEVLRSFPWQLVPMCQKSWRSVLEEDEDDMAEVEEHLMSQLMQLDGWLSTVTIMAYSQISERRSSLELCNQYLRELNHSLTMADIHARRSKESLRQARGDEKEFTGLSTEMFLLEAWDQRDVYQDLDTLLGKCAGLLEHEQQLQQKIDAFGQDTSRYQEIMDAAAEFSRSVYQDEQLAKLTALDDLRERADHVLETFAKKIEFLLVHRISAMCVSWKKVSASEYANLLKALSCARNGEDHKAFADSWTKCIQDALLFEVEKCFPRALLDPTNVTESSYDKDLIQMSYTMHNCQGDYSQLKTLTHNLVTIRFDFEIDENNLAMVYHQLCLLLTDVLYCHQTMLTWHLGVDLEKDAADRIQHQLLKFKSKLWKRCEHVLVSCLETHLSFANKKRFFDDKTDESPWINDLEAMHEILQLTNQFSRIGREFVGKDSKKVTCLLDESSESALQGKLSATFRKHLRVVHVETMTSMGYMLSKESWQLVPLEPVQDGLIGFASLETEFKAYLVKLVNEKVTKCSTIRRLWHNRVRSTRGSLFADFKESGNPFGLCHDEIERTGDFIDMRELEWTSPERKDESEGESFCAPGVYGLLTSMVGAELTPDSRVAVGSCFTGFAKNLSRLLVIMKKLPIIVPDVTKVVQNVSDLFLATVFRVCTGNSINERLILGLETPTPFQLELPLSKRNKNAAPLLGFGRRSSTLPTRPPQRVTARMEAEICSPLLSELCQVEPLKHYLKQAQQSLEGIVKLDMIQGWIYDPVGISPEETEAEYLCTVSTALEKRQGAAWSCLFVAAILDLVKSFSVTNLTKEAFAKLLGEATIQDARASLNGVAALSSYVDTILQITPRLMSFATRMASIRAIGGKRIVEEVCRQDWDANYLSEEANHYVELVCGRYTFVWRFLAMSAKLPLGVRAKTWEHMVAVGYMTFLEGFARVPTCSTEGRSLMSMDLGAFCAGTSPSAIADRLDHDAIPRPPNTAVLPRGRNYVDTYIKVSYLPQDDVMNWIKENHGNYHLNHCLALSSGGAKVVAEVKELYTAEDEGEDLEHRGTMDEPSIARV